jgi:WhiB family redox-sensing transcriptional regulator
METAELVLLDNTQRSYVTSGACIREDPTTFDTDIVESKASAAARTARAKTVCASCIVRKDCLADAQANFIDTGIWGGLTPAERGFLPRKRSGKRKKVLCRCTTSGA